MKKVESCGEMEIRKGRNSEWKGYIINQKSTDPAMAVWSLL